jgi:hypothetical protein
MLCENETIVDNQSTMHLYAHARCIQPQEQKPEITHFTGSPFKTISSFEQIKECAIPTESTSLISNRRKKKFSD